MFCAIFNLREGKHAFHKIGTIFGFFVILFSLSFSQIASATVYQPGETLTPDCAPLAPSCGVAVLSLNNQTSTTQTLVTGTFGTDFNIVSGLGIHTFNIPNASATARGLLTLSDWSIFNGKQDALVSGTNIKTIGGVSLLGSGDIAIGGTGTVTSVTSADGDATIANTATTPIITIVSAPKLTTARTINGISFDGTGNITIPAAAGTLTGATLASNVLNSSLTSVGTLTNLTVTNPITGSITGNASTATNLTGLTATIANLNTLTGALGSNAFLSTAFAPLASPTFTGTVSGITAAMVGAPSGSGTSTGTNTGDNAVNSLYSGLATSKQDALVSGTNIKTINSNSLLGSGNIPIATLIGFTPYNATNPSNYITLTALSGTGPINYNNGTGAISLNTGINTGSMLYYDGSAWQDSAPLLNHGLLYNGSSLNIQASATSYSSFGTGGLSIQDVTGGNADYDQDHLDMTVNGIGGVNIGNDGSGDMLIQENTINSTNTAASIFGNDDNTTLSFGMTGTTYGTDNSDSFLGTTLDNVGGIKLDDGSSGPSNGLLIGTTGNAPVILGTNNTESMRIDRNGNVGIGTTTPATTLDVNGDVIIRGTDSSADRALQIVGTPMPSEGFGLRIANTASGGGSFSFITTDDTNGEGPGDFLLINENATYPNNLTFGLDASGRVIVGPSFSDDGVGNLQVKGTETITNTLAIGTTTPRGPLDIHKSGAAAPATGIISASDQPDDGDTVTITDADATTATFEFDDDASVTPGNVAVTIGAGQDDTLTNLATAISANLNISASFNMGDEKDYLTDNTAGSSGNVNMVLSATNISASGMSGGIDASNYDFYVDGSSGNLMNANGMIVGGQVSIGTTDQNNALTVNGGVDAKGESHLFQGTYFDPAGGTLAAVKISQDVNTSGSGAPFVAGTDGIASVDSTTYAGYFNNNTTVSGSGINYGIYVLGSNNYFSGNIGIGTASPSNILDVTGTPASGTHAARIENTLGGTTQNNGLLVLAGNNTGVNASQMITFERPDATVIGSISQNSATTIAYNTGSDRRIKENITDTKYSLSDLMKIDVSDFDFINDPNHQKTTGFIAQNLENIFPDAVTTNGDNGIDPLAAGKAPWMVDYGRISPLIVKAIQEMNLKIANINDLTKQNDWRDGLVAWFANTANGIGDLFINTSHQKILCVGESGNETCITKTQLDQLLQNQNINGPSSAVTSTDTATTTTPDTTSTTTPAPTSSPDAVSVPDSTATPDSVPAPTLSPDATPTSDQTPAPAEQPPSSADAGVSQ